MVDGTTTGTWKTKDGNGLKMISEFGTKVPIVWDDSSASDVAFSKYEEARLKDANTIELTELN